MSARQRHNTSAAMRLCRAAVTLAMAAGLLAPVSPAAASVDQTTVLDPTPQLLNGEGPARRGDILDRLQALGVNSMRIQVQWRLLAPAPENSDKPEGFDASEPGDYSTHVFEVLDSVVRGAKARGMEPLLTPTGPIPDWASSSGRGSLYDPDPGEFEDFVRALGERYDGTCVPPRCAAGAAGEPLPAVEQWAIWNEPNLKTFLRPQRDGDGRTVSGLIYRSLFLAAQRALADSGHGRDLLLIGETAPSRGSNSTAPLRFLRQVFCLDRGYEPLRHCEPIAADGWAHHPYNPHIPPWQPPNEEHRSIVSIGSMDRLVKALRRSYEASATAKRLPVYVTEYGIESHPQGGFGVSPQRQAEYLGIAEYLLYRDPWVDAFAQYLLDDDRNPRRLLSFQTGLRFANGFPKPSYDAFATTLVARQLNSGVVRLWGHVRPGAGPYEVRIRYRDGDSGPGQQLATVETDRGGYFQLRAPLLEAREWQATAELPGSVLLEGAFIRSYRFP